MKNIYTFGYCRKCKKSEALKNGYCVECSKILTSKDSFKDIFGEIFGNVGELFGKNKEDKDE